MDRRVVRFISSYLIERDCDGSAETQFRWVAIVPDSLFDFEDVSLGRWVARIVTPTTLFIGCDLDDGRFEWRLQTTTRDGLETQRL